MRAFWCEFPNKPPGCVEAASIAEAATKATEAMGREPFRISVLPYPARPRLGTTTDCPDFCHSPRQCAGTTACPQNHSCTE